MSIAPNYPQTIIECDICGTKFDAEHGACPNTTCREGSLTGPVHTYVPMYHIKQSDDDYLTENFAPGRERTRKF